CPAFSLYYLSFFLQYIAPPVVSTLSLHDALPIFGCDEPGDQIHHALRSAGRRNRGDDERQKPEDRYRRVLFPRGPDLRLSLFLRDRKSTRLNSSHLGISYAVFCLKKKKKNK